MLYMKAKTEDQKTNITALTNFLASSPFFILLGYFAMTDAAFLDKEQTSRTLWRILKKTYI